MILHLYSVVSIKRTGLLNYFEVFSHPVHFTNFEKNSTLITNWILLFLSLKSSLMYPTFLSFIAYSNLAWTPCNTIVWSPKSSILLRIQKNVRKVWCRKSIKYSGRLVWQAKETTNEIVVDQKQDIREIGAWTHVSDLFDKNIVVIIRNDQPNKRECNNNNVEMDLLE